MGKARTRRLEWLRIKNRYDSGEEVYDYTMGRYVKKCERCDERCYILCPDCDTWHCTNGNCTIGGYCEC